MKRDNNFAPKHSWVYVVQEERPDGFSEFLAIFSKKERARELSNLCGKDFIIRKVKIDSFDFTPEEEK